MKRIGLKHWAATLATLAVLAGCYHATSPLQGKEAPDFTLPLLKGGEFTLSGHQGKEVVVLDFWATWCGPCRQALPALFELTKEFEGQPVAFYAVNLGDSREEIEGFLNAQGIDLPVALDAKGEVAQKYEVQSIPAMLVIDRAGVVRHSEIGYSPGLMPELVESIKSLINEEG